MCRTKEKKKQKKQKKKYGKGEKIHTNFSKNENHPQYLTRDSLHIHVSVSLGCLSMFNMRKIQAKLARKGSHEYL